MSSVLSAQSGSAPCLSLRPVSALLVSEQVLLAYLQIWLRVALAPPRLETFLFLRNRFDFRLMLLQQELVLLCSLLAECGQAQCGQIHHSHMSMAAWAPHSSISLGLA